MIETAKNFRHLISRPVFNKFARSEHNSIVTFRRSNHYIPFIHNLDNLNQASKRKKTTLVINRNLHFIPNFRLLKKQLVTNNAQSLNFFKIR